MNVEQKLKELTLIAILAVLIFISGMFKIPSIIVGAEFQLSAPIAVAIAACFGFKKYFLAGIVASMLSFALGTQTILNVLVALVFRIIVGGTIELFGTSAFIVAISGPLGTFVSRLVLASILKINPWTLIVAALPGMIFTAITVGIFYAFIAKVIKKTNYKRMLKES